MNYILIVLIFAWVNYFPTLGPTILVKEPWLLNTFFPKSIEGFTFGRFIVVKETPSAKLISHELIHVKQYKRWGVIGFLVGYYSQMLWYYYNLRDIDKAYRAISFEVEAYKNQIKD